MITLATHEDITRQKASRAALKSRRQMSSHNQLPDVPSSRVVGSFSMVRSTCTLSVLSRFTLKFYGAIASSKCFFQIGRNQPH
ncbi:hypothetical protein V8C44DRAFT_323813 [Trichoderma aethiopicum]